MLKKLDEINALLDRSSEHLAWLKDFVLDPENNLTADDLNPRISDQSFNIITMNIQIRIGECATSMRNALNYLTCAFAELDSGSVGNQVQFPIEDTPKGFASRRDSFLEGINEKRITAFERYQPYKAGEWIKLLREFTNFYKHRGLVRVDKKVHQFKILAPVADANLKSAPGSLPSAVEVDHGLSFTVTLPNGTSIIETLETIETGVRNVIDQLNPLLKRVL